MSACEREGKRLICVTLNAPDDWNDHLSLYEYAFPKTESIVPNLPGSISAPLAGGESDTLELVPGEAPPITVSGDAQMWFQVKKPPFIYAPVKKGDEVGSITIYCGDTPAADIPRYAAENACFKNQVQEEKNSFVKNLFRKWFS